MKIEKGDSVAIVAYHTSGKGEDKDAFNNADANGRLSYYGISGVPTAIFNGIKWIVGGWSGAPAAYRDSVNQQMTVNTPGYLTLKMHYDPSSRTGKIYASFYSEDQITETNLHLRYAITESHLHYHWQTQDSLQFIERKMLPNYSGVSFTVNQGETFADSQSFTISTSWVDYNCDAVAWIQSDVATYLKKVLISNQIPVYRSHVAGDPNGDKVVTISDAVFLANYLVNGGSEPIPSTSGDANGDCVIDMDDLVYLIGYLFHGGAPPDPGCYTVE
jgi:hypothetical protein